MSGEGKDKMEQMKDWSMKQLLDSYGPDRNMMPVDMRHKIRAEIEHRLASKPEPTETRETRLERAAREIAKVLTLRPEGAGKYVIEQSVRRVTQGVLQILKRHLAESEREQASRGEPGEWPLNLFCEMHIDTTLSDANVNDPCPLCALAQPPASTPPDGYAYRYHDGIRFNHGEMVNGGEPIESIPYFFAPQTQPLPIPRCPKCGDSLFIQHECQNGDWFLLCESGKCDYATEMDGPGIAQFFASAREGQ